MAVSPLGPDRPGVCSVSLWRVAGAEAARGEQPRAVPGGRVRLPGEVPRGREAVQKERAREPGAGDVLRSTHVRLRKGNPLQLEMQKY